MPEVAQVRNPRLTKALRKELHGRIRLREQEEVIELRTEAGRIMGARTVAAEIEARQIIVCAGAWTARLLEQLADTPDIQPVRGQMILFLAHPGQINRITLYREHYIIPRRDGHVLIGSTLEHSGFVKATTAEVKEALYRAAIEIYPLLKRTPIEDHWAGLRPGSPSGIPYICPYPNVEGLYLNAGHFRNGLVTGPASARLITDLVLGRPPIVEPSPYTIAAPR
jgi:glycine oxidase